MNPIKVSIGSDRDPSMRKPILMRIREYKITDPELRGLLEELKAFNITRHLDDVDLDMTDSGIVRSAVRCQAVCEMCDSLLNGGD